MRRSDSAFAVIRSAGRVLLVKARAKGTWQLPGGAIKSGETPWAAASREVYEETGLRAHIDGLSGIYRRLDGSLVFVFSSRVNGRRELPGPRYEIVKQRWMSLPQAADRLTPGARLRLLDSVRRPGTLRLDFGAGRGAGSSVRFNGLGRRMAAES